MRSLDRLCTRGSSFLSPSRASLSRTPDSRIVALASSKLDKQQESTPLALLGIFAVHAVNEIKGEEDSLLQEGEKKLRVASYFIVRK